MRTLSLLVITAFVVTSLCTVSAYASEEMAADTSMMHATDVIGENLINHQGENLGKIEELVVAKNGKILYAILSNGGVFGFGDKLVAIPWKAINVDGGRMTADISKKTIEDSPKFAKDHFWQFGDPEWNRRVFSYYDSHEDSIKLLELDSSDYRASKMLHRTARTSDGMKLGRVNDLLMSDDGYVKSLLIRNEGQYFVAPFSFKWMSDDSVVLDISRDDLKPLYEHE